MIFVKWNEKKTKILYKNTYQIVFLMFTLSFKKFFTWGASKSIESKSRQQDKSFIIAIVLGVIEDVLFWKNMWLSLSCIMFLNAFFFICILKEISLLEITTFFLMSFVFIDALEKWLKNKHRTSCLRRLASHESNKLNKVNIQLNNWAYKNWIEFVYLRETNHTKAFLLVNLVLGLLLFIGKYINGYLLAYMLCMFLCIFRKIAPPVTRLVKKIQQHADSDMEFEGLIPEISDHDIALLSIEQDLHENFDERQSLDYWKPDDQPLEEEASDSSENSTSLVTNMSIEKMQTLNKDIDTTDSSEDEYIPKAQQKEQLQSTLEVIQPAATWSGSAYDAFWNFTGTVANIIYNKSENNTRKRVSSVDSSDGFEMVDKHDLY